MEFKLDNFSLEEINDFKKTAQTIIENDGTCEYVSCEDCYGYYLKGNCTNEFASDQNSEDEDNLLLENCRDLIKYIDEYLGKPKKGDKVFVSDFDTNDFAKMKEVIFLADVGGKFPYICVHAQDTENYLNGESYGHSSWRYMRTTSPEKTTNVTLDLTDKQIEQIRALGIDV